MIILGVWSDADSGEGSAPEASVRKERLLKPAEAAEFLSISERLLWSLGNAGVLPVVRIGKLVRYDVADLRAWIDEQKYGRNRNRASPTARGVHKNKD